MLYRMKFTAVRDFAGSEGAQQHSTDNESELNVLVTYSLATVVSCHKA